MVFTPPKRVYFISAGRDGPVKIGVSRWPDDRLVAYEKWSPVPLTLLARIEGSHRVEHQFHALFADLHSHHEWFNPSPRIDAVVAQINAGTFDLATLPKPRPAWSIERRKALA